MTEAVQIDKEKRGFTDALSSFTQRNRKLLLFLFVAILAALVALVIVLQIRRNTQETSLLRLEAVQKLYAEWTPLKDEAEKDGASAEAAAKAASLEAQVIKDAEALLSEYEGMYAELRAYDILASVAYRNKEYEKAARLWTSLADTHAASYFAPLALVQAAAAWEEAENPGAAAESLIAVITKFSAAYPDIPHVLFSLGRLAEGRQDYDGARTYYNRLLDEYSGSSWTKLAHNRIILLQIQGRIPK